MFVSLTVCEDPMFDLILGLAVAAGLFVYLGLALIAPHRF
ncbi:MAG: potassium-transporting ATPase subunit F [Cypionkella sp.]